MTAVVVGGGISAMAAAAALAQVGPVTVLDRARRLGGRMAATTLRDGPWSGHVVDVGAAYLTSREPAFAAVVADWQERDLVRPWTATLAVAEGDEIVGVTEELTRYAAPDGLRSLVEDLARQLPAHVRIVLATNAERFQVGPQGFTVQARFADTGVIRHHKGNALALCMPGPQAVSLLGSDPVASHPVLEVAHRQRYEPVLTLIGQWSARCWDPLTACFVNDNPALSFVADDGNRRGDGAAVIVAHSTPELAAQFLTEPDAATAVLLSAVARLLNITEAPVQCRVRRWSLAKPRRSTASYSQPFVLADNGLGLAGDAFDARPRVEAAWISGNALGTAMAAGLTAPSQPTA